MVCAAHTTTTLIASCAVPVAGAGARQASIAAVVPTANPAMTPPDQEHYLIPSHQADAPVFDRLLYWTDPSMRHRLEHSQEVGYLLCHWSLHPLLQANPLK